VGEQPRMVRCGDRDIVQHVDDRCDRGERPRSRGRTFRGIRQLDSGAVFGDGDRCDGQLIVVQGGRTSGSGSVADPDVQNASTPD
jgi:hypothetical protein